MKKWILPVLLFLITACSGDDEKAKELLNKGTSFMDQRNYSSALTSFRDALQLELKPELSARIYRNMAVVFLYQEQLDSARHYSKLGMDVLPEASYYHFINMAEYQLLNDDIRQAISTFQKAQKLDAGQMEVYNNLSLIYSGAYGDDYLDLDKALLNARRACDLAPNTINREQLASVYFQLENYAEAGKLFRQLKQENPEVKIYQFYLGQSLYFQGHEDEGMQLMEEAAARDTECQQLFDAITE